MAKAFPNTGITTGLAADRTSMTSMYAGQYFYETDTGLTFIYTGAAWILPWEQKIVEVSASGQWITASGLSQAGNHMRIEAIMRSPRASVANTGGRMAINNLSGASDYGLQYNNTSGGLQSIGYIGQIPAATALANDVAVINIWIPYYRDQLGLNRMNINSVCTSYGGGTFVNSNHVGGTSSCGAVTTVALRDDVGSTLTANTNRMRVFISS